VALSFLRAYGSFDAATAISFLAADADVSGMTGPHTSDLEGPIDGLRLVLDLLEARGYTQRIDACDTVWGSEAGEVIRCEFDFRDLRETKLGPFGDSHADLTVHDRTITRAAGAWGDDAFSSDVWEPFARWVSRNHPEDAAVMFEDDAGEIAGLFQASVALWEQRTREFARVNASGRSTTA
jgi:hypothetical protein